MNQVILIGNVGRVTLNNNFAIISLATNEYYNDNKYTDWHNIICFEKNNDIAHNINKGDKLVVIAKISYNTKNDITYTNIVAKKIFIIKEIDITGDEEEPIPF